MERDDESSDDEEKNNLTQALTLLPMEKKIYLNI